MYQPSPGYAADLLDTVQALLVDFPAPEQPAAPAPRRLRTRRAAPPVQVTAAAGSNTIVISQRDDILLVERHAARRLARALLRAARE